MPMAISLHLSSSCVPIITPQRRLNPGLSHRRHACSSATPHRRLAGDYRLSWLDELKSAKHLTSSAPSGADGSLAGDALQELVDKRAVDNVRMLVVDAVQEARAGHPGTAMGMSDVGYLLYRHAMRYNPSNPKWFNRDRFVLSCGHACLLQYVLLHLAGFDSVQVINLLK